MGNLTIKLAKDNHRFLIETGYDVSMFGWETKKKHESYYCEATCWNLLDLFENEHKLGLSIEYSPEVLPIREKLLQEYKMYQKAQKLKYLTPDEITDLWDEAGFPYLFPKIQADLHQMRVVLWCLAVKRAGCYMEPGTGKTPVGIFILGKLLMDGLIEKPLVFCPLSLLNKTVWFKDLERFSDFKPINLRTDDEFSTDGHISFVNYDKLQHWTYTKTDKAEKSYNKNNYFEMKRFDGIFYDEASSLKGYSSLRTKAFIEISKYTKYLILATGIPAPNSILQIWGQMKAIGSVLGDSYNAFAQRYGIQRSVGPVMQWFATSQGEQAIRKKIDLVSYFVKSSDVLKLPTRHFVTTEIDLHPEHQMLYEKVLKNYIAAVAGYDEDGNLLTGKAIVEHEVAMRIKLLQILNGFVTIEDQNNNNKPVKVTLRWNAKLDQLDVDIKNYLSDPNSNIIIWCRFRWEVETIYKKYQDIAAFLYGGMSDEKREQQLDFWLNNPNCRLMISIAESSKFGHTWLKANYTIYFSGTECYEGYAQSRDRAYRRGQTKEVTEVKYITNKTIERKIWYAITTRKKLDKFMKDYASTHLSS